MFSGSFLPCLTGVINHSIVTSSFPDELKLAEVMSAFKKEILFTKKLSSNKFVIAYPQKYIKKYFSTKSMTTENLIFRPPDWLSEKSQYTTLLNKNARKMETSFR